MNGCPSGLIGNGPVVLSEGLNKLVSEHFPLRKSLESLFSICTLVEEEQEASFPELIQKVKNFSTNLEHHWYWKKKFYFK